VRGYLCFIFKMLHPVTPAISPCGGEGEERSAGCSARGSEDRDFGHLVYAANHESGGVIYLRFPNRARNRRLTPARAPRGHMERLTSSPASCGPCRGRHARRDSAFQIASLQPFTWTITNPAKVLTPELRSSDGDSPLGHTPRHDDLTARWRPPTPPLFGSDEATLRG
jgi:hypothetical protein